jgi:hypothetical protein
MKRIFFVTIISGISLSHAFAQWPGNFYAFILKDAKGNIIISANIEYKLSAINDSVTNAVLGIETCKDDTIWRFYEGGNHYMGSTQKLKITRLTNGKKPENMIIEFPPSMSKGKENYYRNLYAGALKFKSDTIKIQLPQTDEQWDNLKKIKLCDDGINFTGYYDVSSFQTK